MITDDALMAYLDGEAEPDRVRAIEAAMTTNPALRARIEALQASDQAVRSAFDSLLERPVPRGLIDAVRGEADNVVPMRAAGGGGALARARRSLGGVPAWVGWAVAAQISILVAAPFALQPRQDTAAYHVLGAAPAARPENLMVIFRPETPERVLRETLESVGARIVDGPTTADAYMLHVPQARRAAALAALRGHAEIVLAEPVDAVRP